MQVPDVPYDHRLPAHSKREWHRAADALWQTSSPAGWTRTPSSGQSKRKPIFALAAEQAPRTRASTRAPAVRFYPATGREPLRVITILCARVAAMLSRQGAPYGRSFGLDQSGCSLNGSSAPAGSLGRACCRSLRESRNAPCSPASASRRCPPPFARALQPCPGWLPSLRDS